MNVQNYFKKMSDANRRKADFAGFAGIDMVDKNDFLGKKISEGKLFRKMKTDNDDYTMSIEYEDRDYSLCVIVNEYSKCVTVVYLIGENGFSFSPHSVELLMNRIKSAAKQRGYYKIKITRAGDYDESQGELGLYDFGLLPEAKISADNDYELVIDC